MADRTIIINHGRQSMEVSIPCETDSLYVSCTASWVECDVLGIYSTIADYNGAFNTDFAKILSVTLPIEISENDSQFSRLATLVARYGENVYRIDIIQQAGQNI